MKIQRLILVLTCEHATNHVPTAFSFLLPSKKAILDTHQGWDIGAGHACQYLAKHLACEAFYAKVSRLLIDHNRSLKRQHCFSRFTKNIDPSIQEKLIESYYQPFRSSVKAYLDQQQAKLASGEAILHISVHSFTAKLGNQVRENDIGLLYDPSRPHERYFAQCFKSALTEISDNPLHVRMNYPYLGISDGHTTALRQLFSKDQYLGIELEINQKWCEENTNQFPKSLRQTILNALKKVFHGYK